ncbi:MAG: hypothetical protein WAL72_32605 [Streptosporangiaceae bacterium]
MAEVGLAAAVSMLRLERGLPEMLRLERRLPEAARDRPRPAG